MKYEMLNGQQVVVGWGKKLQAAQKQRVYKIGRKLFERIPFGSDEAGKATDSQSCRDCAAARGQLHVPRCCVEDCPRCGGQRISCDCKSTPV